MSSKTMPNFETSFSNGLDLSEFVSSSLVNDNDCSAPKIESASAELVRLKHKEKCVKEAEEHEEIIMQQQAAIKVQKQIKRLEDSTKQEETKCDAVYGALVSMHVADASGGKKERKQAKTKAQKRTVALKFKKNTKYARDFPK